MTKLERTQNVIDLFFKDNEARFAKETTRAYRAAMKQFFTQCNKQYDEVRVKDIRAWLSYLDECGLKPRSIHLKLASLKSFYRYCLEENLINKVPTTNIDPPKLEDSLPFYLSKQVLAQLMEITKDDLRDRALIESLYTTGVRISELLNIKLDDIKWDTRQIWIRKGKGNKERFVLFSTECAVRLKKYLDTRTVRSPYLFANEKGNPLSRSWAELKFRVFTKGLNMEHRITPHTLRHTFAAHLAEKDMPQSYIQELLGHVNINTTRIYTRLNTKARKIQYDTYQI